jgi:molybdate transport system ATP-binding protein
VTTLLEIAVRKQLKSFPLEVELSLTPGEGPVLVLFGPSGSGKTMTIKCLAGITDPDAGFISIGGKTVFDSRNKINLPLRQRRVSYLPQSYSLFPHLTVSENIAFGLFDWGKSKAAGRVADLLKLMQLEGLEKYYPRHLSGGQQQRVALARALAPEPAILLLDEPFSALDAAIRAELRQNLILLSQSLAVPIVFITHDLEEAYMLGRRIAVYDQGRILQYSRREEVFYYPATRQVARLMGIPNLWDGRALTTDPQLRLSLVRTAYCDLWVQTPPGHPLPPPGQPLTVCLRPEQIGLRPPGRPPGLPEERFNRFPVRLAGDIARGSRYTLFVKLVSPTGPDFPVATAPPDLELEITAQQYAEIQQVAHPLWEVEINPAFIHLIF